MIYLANGFRTLQSIGWDYAEPIARSLVYAMRNHNGEPNPAGADLAADRPGRLNAEIAKSLEQPLVAGSPDQDTTAELVKNLHDASAKEASGLVADGLRRGISTQCIWDGLFSAAAELMLRQRGIVSLHAVTTTKAMHQAFAMAADDTTRKFLLLQNPSFLTLFRQAAMDSDRVRDVSITDLEESPATDKKTDVAQAFEVMGQSRIKSAENVLALLRSSTPPIDIMDHARRLVFLKGNDSHDYKFSAAALKDYRIISSPWRERYLAAAMMQLCSPNQKTQPLVE